MVFKRETEDYKKENEALRAENQRIKDAHAAAGLSFTALNQHAANLQRINKRLTREHQMAVEETQRLEEGTHREVQRLRDEYGRHQDKLQAQAKRAKEESLARTQLYELEVQMRAKMDRTMEGMIALVEKRAGTRDPELVEELVEMKHCCSVGVREATFSRSSLIGGVSSSSMMGEDGAVAAGARKLFSALGSLVKGDL